MNYYLDKRAKIVFEVPDDGYAYFFGYYDISPLDQNNSLLLSHRVAFDGRDVEENDIADVGYWDINNKYFEKIGETSAFNWQQGSNLQWLPNSDYKKIIYNDIREERYVAVIYDIIKKEEEKILPFPIYTLHPSGKVALCVNYERLFFCRPGYNYKGIKNEKWNVPFHPDDGIYLMNIETAEIKLLISTKDFVRFKLNNRYSNRNHWLEHMMWNPSGTRFMFMHRWENEMGAHHTRVFTADYNGDNIHCYPDVRFYSHMAWRDDEHLTIWSLKPNICNKYLKKNKFIFFTFLLYKKIMNILFNKQSDIYGHFINYKDKTFHYEIIGKNKLIRDGHISWSDNGRYLLTDSYEDKDGYRSLFIFDNSKNKIIPLGKFYSNYNRSVYRCDLHPRFSPGKDLIVIDSAHKDKRKQLIIDYEITG